MSPWKIPLLIFWLLVSTMPFSWINPSLVCHNSILHFRNVIITEDILTFFELMSFRLVLTILYNHLVFAMIFAAKWSFLHSFCSKGKLSLYSIYLMILSFRIDVMILYVYGKAYDWSVVVLFFFYICCVLFVEVACEPIKHFFRFFNNF